MNEYGKWYEKLIDENKTLPELMERANFSEEEQKEFLKPNQKLTYSVQEFFILLGAEDYKVIPQKLVQMHEDYLEYINTAEVHSLILPKIKFESDYKYYQKLASMNLPYEDENLSITGANFARSIILNIWGLPIIIILVILCTPIFTEENENGTKKLRKTQPSKRINILLSKLFSAFILSIIFLGFMIILAYFMGGIFGNGFGTFSYPIQRGPQIYAFKNLGKRVVQSHYFEIISIGEWILRSFVIFSSFIFMIIGIIGLVSVFFKDTQKTTMVSMIIYGIGHYLAGKNLEIQNWNNNVQPKFPFFNPFTIERFNAIIKDMRIDTFYYLFIPIGIGMISIVIAHILSKISWIQNFMSGAKVANIDKSLEKWRKSKVSKAPMLKFELKKLLKRQEIYVIIIVLIIGGLFFTVNQNTKYIEAYHDQWDLQEWHLTRYEDILKYSNESNIYNQIKKYKQNIEAYETKNKEAISQALMREILEIGDTFYGYNGYSDSTIPPETLKINSAQYEEVVKRNNTPEIPRAYEVVTTPFDVFKDFASYKEYSTLSERFHPSTYHSINKIFKNKLFLLILGIIIFSIALGLTTEKGNRKTLNLLKIQPICKSKIYISKQLSESILYLGISIIILMIIFVWGAATGKNIDSNYPVVHYDTKDKVVEEDYEGMKFSEKRINIQDPSSNDFVGAHFEDISKENAKMIILLILIGLFIISIGNILSLKTDNRWLNSILTLMVLVIGYFANIYLPNILKLILPFTWFDPYKIASGELAIKNNFSMFYTIYGIINLILWTDIILMVGIYQFEKSNEQKRGVIK